jgi:hypothetical protein
MRESRVGWEDGYVNESAAIIDAMRQAVPPARTRLSGAEISALRDLTKALMFARPEAASEYERFLAVASRGLCLPEKRIARKLGGATVLVTGGTGCIGSVLMREIAARRPARLASVSRGVTAIAARQDGAEYLTADVTDRNAVEAVIYEVRPDIIFHVAAQRAPGIAETEVQRTVSTNVFGARNVLAAASGAGVGQVVLASTGKALRPYSPEIYTASKRAAEWLGVAAARDGGVTCSAARFTHVMDNSIIHRRLIGWAGDELAGTVSTSPAGGPVVRLHSPDIAFYVQSALESAQLLLIAMLGAAAGTFQIHALADLGWPVSLLDVTLGVLARTGSRTPVYVSGYDPGYEEVPFPGLYDPATAGDVSPLLNAFEAAALTGKQCPMVDSFEMELAADGAAPKLLANLESACDSDLCDGEIRRALDDLSWSLLDAALAVADMTALTRAARLARRHESGMSRSHLKITRAIDAHADR